MRSFCTLLCVLTACGFEVTPGTAVDPNSDAPPQPVEDGAVAIDAAVADAMVDARVCVADVDHDGICDDDGNDTWLCGLTPPAAPGAAVQLNEMAGNSERKIEVSAVKLQGGTNLRNVAKGTSFTLSASYSINDCICTGCIDQIQVGLLTQNTKKCIYDANPPCPAASTGTNMQTFTAPTTPGVYAIGFRLGQDFSCEGNSGTATGWWTGNAPNANQTIAKICVPATP